MALFAELHGRLRRALGRRHLERGELGRRITKAGVVRGHLTWDEKTDGRLPLVVVDGEDVTWKELGRMLMSYEGFQIRLEVFDRTEER